MGGLGSIQNKMTDKDIPATFQEGMNSCIRTEPLSIISNLPYGPIPYVKLKDKRDPNLRLFGVDGYYLIKNNKSFPLIRMEKEYQAESFEEANDKAMKEGLRIGILIEQILGEPVKSNLGDIKLTDLLTLHTR